MKGIISIITIVFFAAVTNVNAQRFCIADGRHTATIIVDTADWKGVVRAARDLSDDVRKVTGTAAKVLTSSEPKAGSIIVGTIGRSRLIDKLQKEGKIDVMQVKGQWESYVIDVADSCLIIAGSDKRGTIYGIYEISRQIGVSPWYWWADVPIKHQDRLYYTQGRLVQPSPKVKYRGIFINDEWPSFGGWASGHFGGLTSKMYSHIFELLLRLKANYLWPAMWASRFNEDDPLSPQLADEYGIVMGTSHHEPMMRAHKEYVVRKDSVGPWDYTSNKERINKFFHEGVARNSMYENIITIGMRGDGDVAMGNGNDTENMRTLADVIKGQRSIIKDVYGREDAVPQLWAVFTEVQRYYDAGFNVPDDVTLLLCDNNWGYIRRTAPQKERGRQGGIGLYYHIDMNGGPWNDRWVNTTTLPKLREQLNLAYRSGIDRIWIVNVGDLKPKEIPIDFIMDYAWNPDKVNPGDERVWLEQWTAQAFSEELAAETADIIAKYTKYNLWRKPEVQVPGIFSVENYAEAARIDSLWSSLADRAESLRERIPHDAQDAYFQLVYYPTVASSCVARIYIATTFNHYYASLHDARANAFADKAHELFALDSTLTEQYNRETAGGKWNGMMRDNHIGYTKWSMPERNALPELQYVTTEQHGHSVSPSSETPPEEYSIEACHFDRNIPGSRNRWIILPDLGRGEAAMGSADVAATETDGDKAVLEYDIDIPHAGPTTVAVGILPTQDIQPERGLRLGIALDNDTMTTVDARRGIVDTFNEYTPENIARSGILKPLPPPSRLALSGSGRPMRNEVFDNIRWIEATFDADKTGHHVLRLIMIDPEIVIERIVVNPDNFRYSYFGPPEKAKSKK